ncbi:MAG: alpha/beta fold hydrolase [Hydrogenophaga sp.]|nr:alpha/beta fold hydrolase [Hydrogenophaga sp.]
MSPRPFTLPLPRAQRMAWRERGAREGEAWLVLHGGPGSGGNPGLWAALSPASQRAVMPDQRGSGASAPRGGLRGQTAAQLVADAEALRGHLGIARWNLLGGSWGAVLALLYAQAHPGHVGQVLLRGAFALRAVEIAGVLLPAPRWGKTLGPLAHPQPAGGRLSLPAVLKRRVQLLQSGTPGVASLRAGRAWALMEALLAAHGQRRALRHAPAGAPRSAALRRQWAVTQRGLRRAQARACAARADRRDRQVWRRLRVQARLLRRRAGLRPGALQRAVIACARAGVAVHWVHGDFDAVCPPANSARGAALGRAHGGPVRHTRVHSGHLAHEPAMARALRAAAGGPGQTPDAPAEAA